jgi:hypothetical protein
MIDDDVDVAAYDFPQACCAYIVDRTLYVVLETKNKET